MDSELFSCAMRVQCEFERQRAPPIRDGGWEPGRPEGEAVGFSSAIHPPARQSGQASPPGRRPHASEAPLLAITRW